MSSKPQRALFAYCALASRLSVAGVGPIEALMPFFAEACQQLRGQPFDADQFASVAGERYGISIPRLAVLGLTEELHRAGILTPMARTGHTVVWRYSDQLPVEIEAALSEQEVESVLQGFVARCRLDNRLVQRNDTQLHQALLARLLNIESMRILSRREHPAALKSSASTLQLKTPRQSTHEAEELHLDFLVSQYLLDLRDGDPISFERVSSVAFASMAAEAVACFRDPPGEPVSLNDLTVYLDSPLLLDVLGVNEEYEAYGKELLDAIRANGVTPAVFEHSVVEAENTIKAQLEYLRSGIHGLTAHNRVSAKPDHLAALVDRVADRLQERLRIKVVRSPEEALHRRSQATVGDIEKMMDERMATWGNADAKAFDRKSVWAMLSISQTSAPTNRICDVHDMFLTHNTVLAKIANDSWRKWIGATTQHSQPQVEGWAPVSMSDKQFAGYLWARRGGGSDAAMSRARLLAHCSSAVRPRKDVKTRAYNLAIELYGQERARDIAALLEDREGAKALMRATFGDPEDLTKERMPFVLDKVLREAGEYATLHVKEDAKRALAEVNAAHAQQMAEAQRQHEESSKSIQELKDAMSRALEKKDLEKWSVEEERRRLELTLANVVAETERQRVAVLRQCFGWARCIFWIVRIAIVLTFATVTYLVASLPETWKEHAAMLSALVGVLGFWFVPNLLDPPISKLCTWVLNRLVRFRDSAIKVPVVPPDFPKGQWKGVINDLSDKGGV